MISSAGTILLKLTGGRSNTFLILQPGRGDILVDTSVKLARHYLLNELKRYKTVPDYLILTHGHFDHVGNAAYIRENMKSKVVIHKDEADFLRKGTMNIPSGTITPTKYLVNLANRIKFNLGFEPCEVDIEITDNYKLPGYEGITIIHTPGHSPGSISIIIDNEYAIVGDTMINVALFKVFPPFAENTGVLMNSWKKLLDTGCHTFYPSHGTPITREKLFEKLSSRVKGVLTTSTEF